jgi:hypothetical protein
MTERPVLEFTPTLIEVPGKPLGRHRMTNWRRLVTRLPEPERLAEIQSVDHAPTNDEPLDQGSIGACTGFATEAASGAHPYNRIVSNAEALAIYSRATRDDQIQGTYPPTDTGSTGYFAMQAACEMGIFTGFAMTDGLWSTLLALQTRAVICGTDWYEGMDQPNSGGLVEPSGAIRGGHEYVLLGCDTEERLAWFRNSWGSSFGVSRNGRAGYFCMAFDDLALLLYSDGDATAADPP